MVARCCHTEVQAALRFATAAFQVGIYPNLQDLEIVNIFFNILNHSSNVHTLCFDIKNLYIFPTRWIQVFRMLVTVNGDYIPKQH